MTLQLFRLPCHAFRAFFRENARCPAQPRKSSPPPLGKTPAAPSAAPADAPITNLEMAGDRLKIYSLQNLLTNKRSPDTRDAARLGDVLLPWFEKTVTRQADRLDAILELWQQLLPAPVLSQCRLLGLHRGTLNVALDSAPLRAQLDGLLRGGLLRQLQRDSKGLIFRVKTSVQTGDPSPPHQRRKA